jgi:hypothetical protein
MSVYAMSDIHGRLDLYKQVKAFIKPEDIVYFLGDAGDRGPQPWETIKAIYNDPQFIYLKGNHEDMLVESFYGHMDEIYLCCMNGGTDTRKGLMAEPDAEDWVAKLNNLPLEKEYTNEWNETIILCHAGYTPIEDNSAWPTRHELLWSREHFHDRWPVGYEDTRVVHGHTPIPYLINALNEFAEWNNQEALYKSWDGGALWYEDGHKICIDCASAYYDCCVLLNLDDYTEHIFRGKDFKEKFLNELEDW